MKQVPIRLGPLTLLLTVISICLTTLAILTFTTARADMRLAEKYADTVRTRYALEVQGQEYRKELNALPENTLDALFREEADEDGILWSSFEQDGSKLRVGLRLEDGQLRVAAWRQEKEWNQDTIIGNLWMGF